MAIDPQTKIVMACFSAAMTNTVLGRAEPVDLRQIFSREDKDFTPWLRSNIDQLAKTLGLEITDVSTENPVGDYSLDIIGTDTNSKLKVAIENQLEETDHKHLGQLITYTSGVDARIVVWIASKIGEEHRQALEWLNKNTEKKFFGVEVKAIRIDDSKPAIIFDKIVKPNDWERSVLRTSEESLSPLKARYRDLFEEIVEEYSRRVPTWYKRKPLPQSWLNFGAGRRGFAYGWSFRSNNRFAVELYIDTGDRNQNKDFFDEMGKHKDEIARKFPSLEWERLEDARACRIVTYKKIPDVMTINDAEEKELVSSAIETMLKLTNTLNTYIAQLPRD